MAEEFDPENIDRKQFDKRGEFQDTLNPKELQYIKDSFKDNDTSKTNELDINQLNRALKKYGIEPNTDEPLKQMIEDVERNGKIGVDFDEFIDLVTLKLSEIESMDQLSKVFSLFIGEENLDKIEFKHLRKICPDLTDEEIEEMIEKADDDKDGKINFEEFYKIITKKI